LQDTYSPCAFAYSTLSTTFSSTHSRVFISLFLMWMSEEDMEIATESTSQSMECATSSLLALFHPRMDASNPKEAILFTAFFSSPPIAGIPASICCTPSSSRSLAILNFSKLAKTMPAACSPSRSVVSQVIRGLFSNLARISDRSLIAFPSALPHIVLMSGGIFPHTDMGISSRRPESDRGAKGASPC